MKRLLCLNCYVKYCFYTNKYCKIVINEIPGIFICPDLRIFVMSWIDISILCLYILAMLGVGVYFMRRNKTTDDYYVGGRELSSLHIGLSVVATDVGGGFSIGLGGLGFTMGLSGSWLLFTGLLGAWLSGVFVIPKVYSLARRKGFLSFPAAYQRIFNFHSPYGAVT